MNMNQYSGVRDKMYTGDVIAFGGNGTVSEVIKKVTKSNVSHVGVVLYTNFNNYQHLETDLIMIIESTSLGEGEAGVKINRMSDHVRDYDGDIWLLPLDETARDHFHIGIFNRFMLSQVGKPYDAPQAIMSALDHIRDTPENFDKLFCSELIAAGFEECGILGTINASEVTPAELCSKPIYAETIQLKGKPKPINR